jgi:hypothetical protein
MFIVGKILLFEFFRILKKNLDIFLIKNMTFIIYVSKLFSKKTFIFRFFYLIHIHHVGKA